ncbi:MAG TPA: hypothetical protein VFV03_00240 [Solirubrobacteraceae bacterium]|nr:hypothetical protein [Solirubrobacteraceae bacterium]
MRLPRAWMLPALATSALVGCLVLAPAASAATGSAPVPLGFLGLPSLHSIIEAIAKGFFSALAGALVPGFLKHGTVATIQHLVALPDPARWGHVSELEGDMTFLGMSLMPVTLTVCTLRYWMLGLTGAAHPATALGRCVWATGMLVIYRWMVEQTVAMTNTLTHAILGFPVVADGLASIITVLFGGALLLGAGGVFGAALVILGVVFGASLFASKVALTDVLALAYCAGPPFIALWPIPELSHLARVWGHALMTVVLVPIGWTLLFAVAGALTLDATSVSGGASGGLPGHVEAAFAGLITFVIAVKLPLMLLGELRHILGGAALRGGGGQGQSSIPGVERMRTAQARLVTAATQGVPSLGRSAGRAAGALGAPAGGPVGAARRGLAGAARRTGILPGVAAAGAGAAAAGRGASGRGPGGVRGRLSRAGSVLAAAPREARVAMLQGAAKAGRASPVTAAAEAVANSSKGRGPSKAAGRTQAPAGGAQAQGRAGTGTPAGPRSSRGPSPGPTPRAPVKPRAGATAGAQAPAAGAAPATSGGTAHPAQKVTASARREAAAGGPKPAAGKPSGGGAQQGKPTGATPPARTPKGPAPEASKRRPRSRSGP